MEAIKTNAIRINEFQAQLSAIAIYRGKKLVFSCKTAIKADKDGYYVWIPENITTLNFGKTTKAMMHEAKEMFRNMRYELNE